MIVSKEAGVHRTNTDMLVCSLFAGRSPEIGGDTGGLLEEEREGRRPWREESGRVVTLDDGNVGRKPSHAKRDIRRSRRLQLCCRNEMYM